MRFTPKLQKQLMLSIVKLAILYLLLILALPSPAQAQTLKRGFAWPLDLSVLDPHRISSDTILDVSQHFLTTLVLVDDNDEIQPSLATSWTFDDKGERLTFFLREDAVWSDGTSINAYTVEKSLLRALSPLTNSDAQVLLSFLQNETTDKVTFETGSNPKIRVLDDYTISFAVDSADPIYLRTFAKAITAPLPLQQLNSEQLFPQSTTMLSSGPYKLLPSTKKGLVNFIANDKYYGQTPHYKEVSFEFDEYKNLIEKYLKHDLDLLEYINPSQKEWLEIYYPREHISRTLAGVYLIFDKNLHGEYSKPIRQAMISVLDKKILYSISKIEKKHFEPSGLVYFASPPYKQASLKSDYKIPVEAAIQNMKEAGYNENNRFKLCVTQTNIKFTELFNYIRSEWANLFIDVEFIHSIPAQNSQSRFLYAGEGNTCNLALIGYAVRLNSAEEILAAFFEDGAGLPSTHLKNDKILTEKYKQLKATKDKPSRNLLLAELEKMVLENYSAITITKIQNTSLVKPHVKNYLQAARGNFIAYSQYLR